jgi:hypothetical protein
MSVSRLGFQPLEPSRMHDFWLVTWFSVIGFGVFLGFVGQTNDWLRLLWFTFGTALEQFNARKHPSISILSFLLLTLVIYGWMYFGPDQWDAALAGWNVDVRVFCHRFGLHHWRLQRCWCGDTGSAFRLRSILKPSVARLDVDAANRQWWRHRRGCQHLDRQPQANP